MAFKYFGAMRKPNSAVTLLLQALILSSLGCSNEDVSPQRSSPSESAAMIPKTAEAHMLKLARDGDLAAILRATGHEPDEGYYDQGPETEGDADAYKWMLVAKDFGHRKADDVLGDLLELSSLRYDDGCLVTGSIQYELGVQYLNGDQGFPIDFTKAEFHLRNGLKGARETDLDFEQTRTMLVGRAREVFDSAIPTQQVKLQKNKKVR
jgi:hypothetical protein